LENKERFEEIADSLKVLARASPLDKHLLVVGLRSLGREVAVTGDDIDDVHSLRAANVGLAMGSGTLIARDSADLILINDDLEAIIKAILWGRNIYLNISKFIMFQVTINLSVLLTILIGILVFGESPLTPV
jgi:Ca2+ transporting ATPase